MFRNLFAWLQHLSYFHTNLSEKYDTRSYVYLEDRVNIFIGNVCNCIRLHDIKARKTTVDVNYLTNFAACYNNTLNTIVSF
jgi:hypothetical protein